MKEEAEEGRPVTVVGRDSMLKELFTEQEFKDHMDYLKRAYRKDKRWEKLKDSALEKIITAAVTAVAIFSGSAILAEVRRMLSSSGPSSG